MSDTHLDSPRPAAAKVSLRGLRVILVGPAAPPIGGMTVQAALLEQSLLRERARVQRVPSNPVVNVLVRNLPLVGGALRLMTFRRRFRAAISEGADVCHVHSASWTYFWRITAFALREAHEAGLHTVLRWDGGEAASFFATAPHRIREAMAPADEIVVPSGFLAEIFQKQLGLDVRVIANLVEDPGVVRPNAPRGGPLRLFCARHCEPGYGIEVVLEAAARAAAEGTDLTLTIAGDGALRPQLEKQGKRVLGDRVTFLGRVPRERVLDQLASTDVVVNGSAVDNFPVALAEALMAGVPVVSTAAGGIPWIIQDGRTGLLTPVGDSSALAGSIRRLAADRALVTDLGRRGRHAAAQWTWDAVRPQWADAYGRSAGA